MINNVTLVGRLTKDPDLRFTGSGVAVANFTIAANRPFKNSDGEREADFISCVIWREAAENLSNLCRKGMLIGVTGRIQTRNYENNEGRTVYVTEVQANNFQLLEKRDHTQQQDTQSNFQTNNQGQRQNQTRQQGDSFTAQDVQQNKQNTDSFNSSDDSIQITDEDLPF